LRDALRGPNGPERLECATCHKPEAMRTGASPKKPAASALMTPITYQQQCARCHLLFFDERIDEQVPHDTPEKVHPFVRQALAAYIQQNPKDLTKPDDAVRRVPLNFPRPVEPSARSPQEWVARRTAFDEQILWNKTCAECHEKDGDAAGLPVYAKSNITRQWMLRAAFDHTPHAMVRCESCHDARASTKTSDVLLPKQVVCATCHSPSRGAESRCFECHRYHDWTKTHPVSSTYTLTDFK
jgi:predicted CXXCH cytochrome family protein